MREKRLSYSEIIPDDIQAEIIQAGVDTEKGAYTLGRISNMLWDTFKNMNPRPVKRYEINAAVGHGAGKTGATIRGYSEIESFWTPALRAELPQFSMGHIRAVMPHTEGDTHKAKVLSAIKLLDAVLIDYKQNIPSVDGLRTWLQQRGDVPPPWKRRLAGAVRKLELVAGDTSEDNPPSEEIRRACVECLRLLV